MEHLLNTPALQSFDQFFSGQPPSHALSRTRGVIVRLATRDGFKGTLTVRDVVIYGYSDDPKKVDTQWGKIRECGQKALESIDKWLASLELHRGMKF